MEVIKCLFTGFLHDSFLHYVHQHTQHISCYATVGSAIVAIAIWGEVDEQAFRPQWQFRFQVHFDK